MSSTQNQRSLKNVPPAQFTSMKVERSNVPPQLPQRAFKSVTVSAPTSEENLLKDDNPGLHLMSCKSIESIVQTSGLAEDLEIVRLLLEFKEASDKLANIENEYSQVMQAVSFAKKSIISFSNDVINPQVFDYTLTSAKAKLNQFWTHFQHECKENVFQFRRLGSEAGLMFLPEIQERDRARLEKQFSQHTVLKRALDYMNGPANSQYPIQEYVDFLIQLDVHRKVLYQYTQRMHPQDWTQRLALHLAEFLCLYVSSDYQQKDQLRARMVSSLKDFCEMICNLYWITKLMGFRSFVSKPCVELFQSKIHDNRDNIDGSDDIGTHIFCSLVPGFEDSNHNVVSKEICLTFTE